MSPTAKRPPFEPQVMEHYAASHAGIVPRQVRTDSHRQLGKMIVTQYELFRHVRHLLTELPRRRGEVSYEDPFKTGGDTGELRIEAIMQRDSIGLDWKCAWREAGSTETNHVHGMTAEHALWYASIAMREHDEYVRERIVLPGSTS